MKPNSSKKFKIIFCWLIFLFLVFSSLKPVLSQVEPGTLDILKNVANRAGYETETPQDPVMIIIKVVNYLLTLVGVLFVLMIIYGGLMWMTGGATDFLWLGGASQEEKIKALMIAFFQQEFPFRIQENKLVIETKNNFSKFVVLFKDKFKEILNLELEVEEKIEEVANKSEKPLETADKNGKSTIPPTA